MLSRIIQVAYHFDITDVTAIALYLLIPFLGSASGFRRNTKFTIVQDLGGRRRRRGEGRSSSLINRSWKHLVISQFSGGSCLIISLTTESHRSVDFVFSHLGDSLKYYVNGDFSHSPFFCEMSATLFCSS